MAAKNKLAISRDGGARTKKGRESTARVIEDARALKKSSVVHAARKSDFEYGLASGCVGCSTRTFQTTRVNNFRPLFVRAIYV